MILTPVLHNRRMTEPAPARPLAVIALGGNALLRRGEPASAANQLRSARAAAKVLGLASETARLVITHGNGPQVGLLALKLLGPHLRDSVPR